MIEIKSSLALIFARLLLQIFRSRPSILYLVFFYFVSRYACQSVSLFVHQLSFIQATCPAHLHFCCLTTCIMSFTLVFSLVHVDLFLSLTVIPNIILSMAFCAILSEFSACSVGFHVSHPYVEAGITHCLYILLFNHIGILLFNMSRFLPNVNQPIFIRRFISLS